MSKIEVDAIDKQSGSTLTLGGSGTAVTLASGATQSGFGRTGTVDWQTSIKTATFTAASGEGYFCNTSGGAFTVNLPSSPSVGDIVAIKDYGSSFATNNLTIGRGGSNLNGDAQDSVRNTDNESLTLVYADATKGWLSVEEGTGFVGENFIVASGGTETTSGNFKIHTFTGPGTFTVSSLATNSPNNVVDYMVAAGGGGSGQNRGGGGGGGGFRESSGAASGCYSASPLGASVSALPVTAQGYPITVGGGGAAAPGESARGSSGVNSVFSTITSAGGGGGGGYSAEKCGANGGSGGGAGSAGPSNVPSGRSGGSGNTPPVSPPQGQDGGAGPRTSQNSAASGGGGAGSIGSSQAPPSVSLPAGGTNNNRGASIPAPSGGLGGDGGAGVTTSINGTATGFAGGGGGGGSDDFPGNSGDDVGGTGGLQGTGATGTTPQFGAGNGGTESGTAPANGVAGTVNTGGGAGGGAGGQGSSAAGGSGIVIIRYKFQ